MLSNFLSNFRNIIKYGCLAHCTFQFVGDFVVCSGPSMEPTLHSDDVLLTEHVSTLRNKINKGDIVIAKCPTNPNQQICKRVVALPGEKVKTGFTSHVYVPIGHVWLEGDNSYNSLDSRSYGPVPQGLIKSRAVCKVWPLKDLSLLVR
ncbi:mitochondrial inner membrane protease subunit 1 [Diorhabda sublineata]|uniref:mitochondrial inner membrane protease subunit 1 n=1 Tax=Diorhabda sublineata TaxID=1163346 RepID=UPI0024E0CE9C|nr:mitochondrial inner membrane protease subunit 1 [Diorhabda sublineata]